MLEQKSQLLKPNGIQYYDTTLRDGTQETGVSFSVEQKLLVTTLLDELGINRIEGGFAVSNETDREYFRRVQSLNLKNALVSVFGSTRLKNTPIREDPGLKAMLATNTPVATIVGKGSLWQVERVLQTSPQENLAMIGDTIAYLKDMGREAIFDAEHFFQGFKYNPEYALETLRVAARNGADSIALCDTNGWASFKFVERVTKLVTEDRELRDIIIGIHAHDDKDLATANTLSALLSGARQVQGTANGLGERLGNTDLFTIIGNINEDPEEFGLSGFTAEQLRQLAPIANRIFDAASYRHVSKRPYTSQKAATHKAGFHADGDDKDDLAYLPYNPEKYGNKVRVVVSELGGKANVIRKLREMNFPYPVSDKFAREVIRDVKTLSHEGYFFEDADVSVYMIALRKIKGYLPPITVTPKESLGNKFAEVSIYETQVPSVTDPIEIRDSLTESELRVMAKTYPDLAENQEPVRKPIEAFPVVPERDSVFPMFESLKKELVKIHPEIADLKIVGDVIQKHNGTTRVLVDFGDGENNFTTVAASEDLYDAQWQAIVDATEFSIFVHDQKKALDSIL